METSRYIALQALGKMEKSGSYSNLTIDSLLKKSKLDNRDKSLASNIFYGVLENKILLDYIIQKYSKIPLNKISIDILNILRMGIYQLINLDLKDFAAVNESVLLTKATKQKSASGFVNAILRQFLREDKQIIYPNNKNEFLSVKYSCSKWLVDKLIKEYGNEQTKSFLASQLGKPPFTIRVNTALTNTENLLEQFRENNIDAKKCSFLKNCITISNGTDLVNTSMFKQGMFHVQDVSSQICAKIVASYAPKTVLDCCAAPGGKTFTIAQEIIKTSNITACDLHQHRVNLISSGAKRLHLENIIAIVQNANVYNEKLGKFDLVLCDVPCSGFGVIRRKPEIKYKSEESIKSLPSIQYNILKNASNYLSPEGVLIYSTCTILPEENQMVVQRFLSENSDFELCQLPIFIKKYYPEAEFQVTMLPDKLDNDGFYICAIRRREV